MKYLVFRINSFRFALDVNKVVEIQIPGVNGNTLAEKMLAEKSLLYQEKQIPIIILAEYLFDLPSKNRDDFRIILIETDSKQFGLLVDNADEIVCLAQEDIITTAKSSHELKADLLDGKFVEEDKEIYIVAPDKIISAVKAV